MQMRGTFMSVPLVSPSQFSLMMSEHFCSWRGQGDHDNDWTEKMFSRPSPIVFSSSAQHQSLQAHQSSQGKHCRRLLIRLPEVIFNYFPALRSASQRVERLIHHRLPQTR
ncbi:unnamed protein product [Lota lota]